MTVLDLTTPMRTVESLIAAQGFRVQISDPKAPPSIAVGEQAASVRAGGARVHELTAGNGAGGSDTIEVQTLIVEVYGYFLDEPGDALEIGLASNVNVIVNAILADADLGGSVRNIDAAGQYGQPLEVVYGYKDIGGRMFRTAEIVVPFIVDGSSSVAL